jgi:excisionase family DNA binding protein
VQIKIGRISEMKNYLTTGQAAAIFDVDPDTVLRWIKSGEIQAIRTPGGHAKLFCTESCKDCQYYKSIFPITN